MPEPSVQTARNAAQSASQFERPADPSEIAEQVWPLLDEDVLPVVVGKISYTKAGVAQADKRFSIDRAKVLAISTGMPNRIVGDLSSSLDDARTQRSRYEHAREQAMHSDDPVVRDACEMFAQSLADPDCGTLALTSENLERAWAVFGREFAERAGPRLIESGAISGPDRYGGYKLMIPAESVFAELAPPPR